MAQESLLLMLGGLGDGGASTSDIPAPTQADQAAWYDVMPKWQAAVSAFDQARNDLAARLSIAQQDPTMYAAVQSQLATMDAAESQITEIANAVTDVKSWLSGTWDAITGAWSSAESSVLNFFGLSGYSSPYLGFAPVVWLIGITVVTSATAYITSLATSAVEQTKKLDTMKSYVDKGYTPAQAAAAVDQASKSHGFLSDFSDILKWLAIAGAVGGGLYLYSRSSARDSS